MTKHFVTRVISLESNVYNVQQTTREQNYDEYPHNFQFRVKKLESMKFNNN